MPERFKSCTMDKASFLCKYCDSTSFTQWFEDTEPTDLRTIENLNLESFYTTKWNEEGIKLVKKCNIEVICPNCKKITMVTSVDIELKITRLYNTK